LLGSVQTNAENIDRGKIFFPNLDGLRFIAFLMVFMQHGFLTSLNLQFQKGTFINKLFTILFDGGTGVSIFFVLSGFLITYLLLAESESNGKINVLSFYARRTLRIWPLYFVVITFALVIYPLLKSMLGISSPLSYNTIYYYAFLSNFDVINLRTYFPGQDSMSSITWSVAIEEQFYLIWPLLFCFLPKKFYKYIFGGVILVSLLFRFVHSQEHIQLYFHSLGVCADLAIGGLGAYFAIYSAKFRDFFQNLSKPAIILLYGLGIAWLFYHKQFFNFHYAPVFSRLISTAFFAFIILEQNFSKRSFFKFSKNRLLSSWGKYTYGLYLLHPVAITLVAIALKLFHVYDEHSFMISLFAGFAALALSMVLSYFSYVYYEKKFLLLKSNFDSRRNPEFKPATVDGQVSQVLVHS